MQRRLDASLSERLAITMKEGNDANKAGGASGCCAGNWIDVTQRKSDLVHASIEVK
ncbi:hypothetical protein [Kosakonia pseudosacchari]|uniref:hypothetical protein n=1 Tax=Kosakonia pseudosacchari TaxID=1646340 RepID=UPI001596D90C|nr:hypothetical protein [Kosakonia pseudosacchari]QOV66438.1 hypothetical protein IP581_06260 [Kosakonia pseudosacchari]